MKNNDLLKDVLYYIGVREDKIQNSHSYELCLSIHHLVFTT